MVDWRAHAEREERRYEDGLARLPDDPDGRQKQLVRTANAAVGAGLARLMSGEGAEARRWLSQAADRYRESFEGAPPDSFGRLIGAVKMRVLAGDRSGAEADARWTLAEGAAEAESPIGRYAAALAFLVLGDDPAALSLARSLEAEPSGFPPDVAGALFGLAEGNVLLYADGLSRTLRSFETREAYLEDVPVADTVLVLEALAEPRGLAQRPTSPLLPAA